MPETMHGRFHGNPLLRGQGIACSSLRVSFYLSQIVSADNVIENDRNVYRKPQRKLAYPKGPEGVVQKDQLPNAEQQALVNEA